MASSSGNPVLAELKKLKPARVRLYFAGSSEPRDLEVTDRRQRWSLLGKAIEAYPNWVRLEALAKGDAVIGVINNPRADEDDLDPLGGVDEVDDELFRATANQTKLILHAIDSTLTRANRHNEGMMGMCLKVLEVVTDRVVALEQLQHSYLERLAADALAADPSGGLMSDKLIEVMGPELMRKLLQAKPATPAPARPPKSAAASGNNSR